MKTFLAFLKKEVIEYIRTGRAVILGILFLLFGIMNPAFAKLTPWLLNLMSESMTESGIIITEITVDAMSSWTQFYKNIPTVLIIFVLITCGTLTAEGQKGTLISVLTKGLSRAKVLFAKFVSLALLWTVCYWLYFVVTYGYTVYFWDNSVAQNLVTATLSYYLFGLWTVSLIILFSAFAYSNTGVLLGCGGVCVAAYLFSLVPILQPYTPMRLTDMSLLTGALKSGDMLFAAIITIAFFAINSVLSVLLFNKKKL